MKIGIIGAGRMGQALARRLLPAGHEIMISNSRGADAVREIAAALDCLAGSAREAAAFGDIVVVTVPLNAFDALPAQEIGSRVVIDTCNYYPGRDGVRPEFEDGSETTSGQLQTKLPNATVVKALNSILANDLAVGGAATLSDRIHAIPIASDSTEASKMVEDLVRDAGLDPVYAGPLSEGWRFERARPAYCRPLDADALRAMLEGTKRSDFVPEGSWRG